VDYYGVDSFTFVVNDGTVNSTPATIFITVTPVNDPPVADPQTLATDEDQAVDITLTGSDPDGDSLIFTVLNGPAHGTLTITGANLTYTPAANYSGTDSFTFKANDGTVDSAPATVSISVTPVDDPPPQILLVSGPTVPFVLGNVATINLAYGASTPSQACQVVFVWEDGTTTVVTGIDGTATATHQYAAAGVYGVTVTVTDDDGAEASSRFEYVVIYDPNGGFVTGGGWIDSPVGAYAFDPTLSGKATFGFVSKYKKGQSVPTGETQFQFQAGDFRFQSTAYEWLVVSGAKAQYKGVGTVNGVGDYGFLLTATDGQVNGGGGVDKFRIKVWDRASEIVVYDNLMGQSDDLKTANPQVIGGGSIVIHQAK
jgi:hypothetical protein